MEGILKFNLPDDNTEFNLAVNAFKYWNVIYEFDQQLRNKLKYDNISDEEYEIYDKMRESLHDLINENNISLDI